MRSHHSMMSLLSVAATSLAMSAAISPMPAAPARSGEGQRRRPAPAYERKTPTTAYDFARLEQAERKRARKAAKLVRDFALLAKQEA